MKVRDQDIQRFTTGDCHIFARAVNKLTGWPLHAFVSQAWPFDIHAFTKTPEGYAFDVEGAHTLREFRKRWKEPAESVGRPLVGIEKVSWERMREDFGPAQFGKYSYTRARVLAPRILEMHGY